MRSNVVSLPTPEEKGPPPADISVGYHASAIRLIFYIVQMLADILAIVAGYSIVMLLLRGTDFVAREVMLIAFVAPAFVAMALFRQAYSHRALMSLNSSWSRAITALVLAGALLLAVAATLKVSADYSRLVFMQGMIVSAIIMLLLRGAITEFITNYLIGRFVCQIVIRDGIDVTAPKGYELIVAKDHGLRPDIEDPRMLNHAAMLLARADEVVVACAPEDRAQWSTVLKGLGVNGELLIPELADLGLLRGQKIANWPTLQVSCGPLSMRNRVVKRLFDIAVAVPLLIILAIPLLLVALAIRIDSRGPVLFRQQRMGRHNRMFSMLKFRSMRVENCDADGNQSTARDDDRITRIGRFIRATSIDELPQLLNVILGDMSLVGPRPHALGSRAANQLFWEVDAQYWTRHAVKPGITGLAQIRGYRGATHKTTDLTGRLQADLEYLDGWTLWRDIVIIAKTALVLLHRNAY